MDVTVTLHGILVRHSPDGEKTVMLPLKPNASVRDVTDALGIAESIAFRVLVNGRHGDLEARLADGDLLVIFPLAEGG